MLGIETLVKRVDRTCSDVAKDDAERSENEAAVARRGILVILGDLVGCAAGREGLLDSFAREDLPRMIRHALPPLSAGKMLRRSSRWLVEAN
jgi:hypothetical protein